VQAPSRPRLKPNSTFVVRQRKWGQVASIKPDDGGLAQRSPRRRQAERVRAAILAASIDLDGHGKCGRHDSATKSMAG